MKFNKQCTQDKVFDIINHIVLLMLTIIVLTPLLFVISSSISDPNAIYRGEVFLFPKDITFEGYIRIFNDEQIFIGYKNTIIYTICGTILNLFLTFTSAYSLSRKNLKGKSFFVIMFTVTMFFQGGLIPTYLLVKNLGILDTLWAMILPGAVSFWNIVITRSYLQSNIPEELFEAAKIDGSTHLTYFRTVILPLSAPIIAVMALFYGVGHWNNYFNALIYMSTRAYFPLQLFLKDILIGSQAQANMMGDLSNVAAQQKLADLIKYGIIIVSSLPVLLIYPFLQKYFVKGILVGSVKG